VEFGNLKRRVDTRRKRVKRGNKATLERGEGPHRRKRECGEEEKF